MWEKMKKIKKEKKRVVEQAKRPIAKNIREIVEKDWIVEVEIEKKREKAKRCKYIYIDRYLLKIEESYPCKWCLKAKQEYPSHAFR